MVREKKSMIGFDPLAWLEDEEPDTNESEEQKAVKPTENKKNSEAENAVTDTHEAEEKKPEIDDEVETENNAVEDEEMEQQLAAPLSGHPAILLNSIQDISKVQALKADILVLIKDNDEIDIDGEAVERIDGSSLQLLCALFDYAEHNALVINWVNPSDSLKQSVNLLGMQEVLKIH